MDGITLASAEDWGNFNRSFHLPPSETGLPQPLHIKLYSGLFRIHCQAFLREEPLTPCAVEFGAWHAPRGCWPSEEDTSANLQT